MAPDDLLRKAQRGDPQALDTLFRREWQPIYAMIYRSVQNRAEAEDLTQDVFLRALKALDRYQETGAPFGAFLAAIARNLLRNKWRQKRPAQVDLDHLPELASRRSGPEDSVLASDRRHRINDVLATLPPDYQTVIRLRIFEDRPAAEVAALMGRSPGAIRVLQHRALTALRSKLPEGTRQWI